MSSLSLRVYCNNRLDFRCIDKCNTVAYFFIFYLCFLNWGSINRTWKQLLMFGLALYLIYSKKCRKSNDFDKKWIICLENKHIKNLFSSKCKIFKHYQFPFLNSQSNTNKKSLDHKNHSVLTGNIWNNISLSKNF